MMAERSVPAPPIAPGEWLRKKFLAGSNITQDQLAKAMGVSRFSINQIINGRRTVTADMALRLSVALNTSPEIWIGLQMAYDIYYLKLSHSDTYANIKPVLNAELKGPPFEDRD